MVGHPTLSKCCPLNSIKRMSRSLKAPKKSLYRCVLSCSCTPKSKLNFSCARRSYPLGSSVVNLDNIIDSRANDLIGGVVERDRCHLVATLQVIDESFSSRIPNFNWAIVWSWSNKRISSSSSMYGIYDSLMPWNGIVSKRLFNQTSFFRHWLLSIF